MINLDLDRRIIIQFSKDNEINLSYGVSEGSNLHKDSPIEAPIIAISRFDEQTHDIKATGLVRVSLLHGDPEKELIEEPEALYMPVPHAHVEFLIKIIKDLEYTALPPRLAVPIYDQLIRVFGGEKREPKILGPLVLIS